MGSTIHRSDGDFRLLLQSLRILNPVWYKYCDHPNEKERIVGFAIPYCVAYILHASYAVVWLALFELMAGYVLIL